MKKDMYDELGRTKSILKQLVKKGLLSKERGLKEIKDIEIRQQKMRNKG